MWQTDKKKFRSCIKAYFLLVVSSCFLYAVNQQGVKKMTILMTRGGHHNIQVLLFIVNKLGRVFFGGYLCRKICLKGQVNRIQDRENKNNIYKLNFFYRIISCFSSANSNQVNNGNIVINNNNYSVLERVFHIIDITKYIINPIITLFFFIL